MVRNRIRLRLRVVYRLNEDAFSRGWDIVVVARTRAITARFDNLTQAYLALAEKMGLLSNKESEAFR